MTGQVTGQVIAEVRVIRTKLQWPFTQRWRWDVTWQKPVDGKQPGVKDARLHLYADFGYTRTQWGAWRAVRRVYTRKLALHALAKEVAA